MSGADGLGGAGGFSGADKEAERVTNQPGNTKERRVDTIQLLPNEMGRAKVSASFQSTTKHATG